jgi:hypothetical protein
MRHATNIPLDTLGNPLPPPVRSEHICKIPKKEWSKWWINFHNDRLEKELDCNVCGLYIPTSSLIPVERETIDSEIQRKVLNTTASNIRICRSCKAGCDLCERTTISAQKKKHSGFCQKCVSTKQTTTKKRKTVPPGC